MATQKRLALGARTESTDAYKNQPLSFLVCERLDFNATIEKIVELSPETTIERQNMILSLKDGLYTYYIDDGGKRTTSHYPVIAGNKFHGLLISDTDPVNYIAIFVSYILQHLTSCNRKLTDIVRYLPKSETESLAYAT